MIISAPSPVTRQPVLLLQAVVGFFILFKLAYFIFLPPIGDEAYYWLWGQRPELSYFDHPPLHAWLLGLVSHVFGWNMFSLRVLTLCSLGGTAWIFWLWAKRIAPENNHAWCWAALAIYLGSPLFFVIGSISFHDHLLIVLCLASGHFFLTFAEQWQSGKPGFGRLYLAALFLGLAVLTKYNGLFLAIGYLLFIVIHASFRPLLRRWQTYAAGAISIGLQAPVIYWNVVNRFASFRFQSTNRLQQSAIDLNPGDLYWVVFTGILALSIFLVIPLLRLYYRPDGNEFERLARFLSGLVLAISTAVIFSLVIFAGGINGYWNDLAYPLAVPLTASTFGTRVTFWLHIVFGALLSLIFFVDFAVVPISALLGLPSTTDYSNYDWPHVAAIVASAKAENPQSFLAATRYTTAAQLAFAIHDPDVTDISERPTEFSIWFDPAAHLGQSAIILAAPFIPIDYARTQFRTVTLLQNIEIERFGYQLGSYQLYRGDGYCGGTCR